MRRRQPWVATAVLLQAVALGLASGSRARAVVPEAQLPAEVQVELLVKVLSFDRRLGDRAGAEVVVGIVHQARFRESADLARELAAVARRVSWEVERRPCRFTLVEVGDGADIGEALRQAAVDVVYVAPLRALPLAKVTGETRARQLVSFTAVSDYVAGGLAVGLVLRGQRPAILVNLDAATAEGSEFDSQLLKLVTVVEERR